MSVFQLAHLVTGAPADILRGLAFAESSIRANPAHPDPLDQGMFGLHESAAFRAERVGKWFCYNALDPVDSAIIAGRMYVEARRKLGYSSLAIAAHKQGVTGVIRDGALNWYVDRVIDNSKR